VTRKSAPTKGCDRNQPQFIGDDLRWPDGHVVGCKNTEKLLDPEWRGHASTALTGRRAE